MKRYIYLALAIILAGGLYGCYGPYDSINPYPWYRHEEWHCSEIEMTIYFIPDEQGQYSGAAEGNITIGDKVYVVGIAFQKNAIGFLADVDEDGIPERLLDGTWSYSDENFVVQICEETIFSGQYTKLTFVPCEYENN